VLVCLLDSVYLPLLKYIAKLCAALYKLCKKHLVKGNKLLGICIQQSACQMRFDAESLVRTAQCTSEATAFIAVKVSISSPYSPA
jgi:hypothetical protein